MVDRFDEAIEELSRSHDDHDHDPTAPVLHAIPMSGASVSTLGGFLGEETIAFSDPQAARVDELQFDLGEGPCWDAVSQGRPVLEPDVRRSRHSWPAFTEAIRDEQVGALFAFPLSIGAMRIGALDLYCDRPYELDAESEARAGAIAAVISRWVLRRAVRIAGDVEHEDSGRHSRRAIHQATGFVIAQLGVSPDDAQLLIQGHALAQERSMHDIAEDIIARRLTFTVEDQRIEDER